MPSSLRPRASKGQAVTNICLKINWSNRSTDTSTASSPLDTPESSSHNTPYHMDSSPLSSLEDGDPRSIPFPELDVPELDLQLPPLDFQLLPRYKKIKPLKSISAIPDYNLDKFFAIAQTKIDMPTETPQIFHGNGHTEENPADFLKSFNRAMRQQTINASAEKLEAFGDYLGTGSQAEIWFKALQTANQEVGTRTTLYDRECWTHVAWATKALQLAMSAGIATSMSMIWQVRGKLPSIVKDLLKDTEYMNWAEFTKEVTELKGTRLMEKKEQHAKQELEVSLLCADVARLQQRNMMQNPITALQNQLSRMTINPSTMSNAHCSNNTVTRALTQTTAAYPQSTFTRQPNAAPQPWTVTEDMKTMVRQLIALYMHHQDTAAGRTAYTMQIAQWNARWGENTRVTHEMGYPLKPGMVVIPSSKCFVCGMHGHHGRNCPIPPDHPERLTRKEAAWRVTVSKVLGLFNHMVATPISLVFGNAQQSASAWIEEIQESSEGKENGSANIQAEERVLKRGEAPHEDKSTVSRPNPINELIDNTPAISVPISTGTIQIVDLYTAGHVKATRQQVDAKEAVPFLHQVSLEGPKGEIVRVRALFDDGAMHKKAMLNNQIKNTPNEEESLTLDNKQWRKVVGGLETPPSRQVLTTPSDKGTHETNNEEEHAQISRAPYVPMGQWRPMGHQQWHQDKKRVKQLWRRVENKHGRKSNNKAERYWCNHHKRGLKS
ncbi:uncharacterized protein EDB91DRAFT_1079021 [Suillus paluster]|uniref:uncharacterized protein n=1 Tax=Suillus paluster TaxID=48578 RepID=UPI001B8702E4|nr:uncharacterized protein EDB91DRAFT_1079021 [Suillus paluster]KAG1748886.1 hypothetical protein EDB91DRAFT_1079021 [Suillus paluster]